VGAQACRTSMDFMDGQKDSKDIPFNSVIQHMSLSMISIHCYQLQVHHVSDLKR
jgi:hypothetical protein